MCARGFVIINFVCYATMRHAMRPLFRTIFQNTYIFLSGLFIKYVIFITCILRNTHLFIESWNKLYTRESRTFYFIVFTVCNRIVKSKRHLN